MVEAKLVMACPDRSCKRVAIWCAVTLRDHPCWRPPRRTKAAWRRRRAFHQRDLVVRGQCCKRRLQHWEVRPCPGETLHVPQVPGRSLRFREAVPDVGGKARDHLGAPALLRLAFDELPPDAPIRIQQLAVDSRHSARAAGADLWATVSSKLGYQSGMEEAAGTHGNDAVVFPGSVASSWDGMCLLSFAVVVTLGGGTDKIEA